MTNPAAWSPNTLLGLVVLQLLNTLQLCANSWGLNAISTPRVLEEAALEITVFTTTSSTPAPFCDPEGLCHERLGSCLDTLWQCTRPTDKPQDALWYLALAVVVLVCAVSLSLVYWCRKPVPPVRRWGQLTSSPSPPSSLSPVSEVGEVSFVSTPSSRRAARGL
jgi:hypothetical protein